MNSLQNIIRKKLLGCTEKLRKKDLLTDHEYRVVSDCSLNEVLQIESTPFVLEQICEGEKIQIAEFYDQQEKKYRRFVAKINRKVIVKPTLPRIVEVDVPVPVPARDASRPSSYTTQNEPVDIIRETTSAERSIQPTDLYQIAEEIREPLGPLLVHIEDDNFGSNEEDGARDFLELCTGTILPPMTARESSTQDLLLAQLGIPVQPLVDNFKEIDLRGIGTPLFQTPMKTSTPYVDTVTDTLAAPIGEIEEDAQAAAPHDGTRDPPVDQAQQDQGQLVREMSSSSSSTAEAPPPVPRSRRVVDFTRRLPLLADILPRSRRSFDIFSYEQQRNLYSMIEQVQSQLFQRQSQPHAQSHLQRLLDASLIMRAAAGPNGTGTRELSALQQSNEQGSRGLFTTPAVESSGMRSGTPLVDLSNLPDPQGQMGSSGSARTVPLVAPLKSMEEKMIEMSDNYRLPSLTSDTGPNATAAASQVPVEGTGTYIAPRGPEITINITNADTVRPIDVEGQRHKQGAIKDTVTAVNAQIPGLGLSTMLFNQVFGPDMATEHSATAQIDSMLLDMIIVVQGEMCHGGTDDGYFVSIQRLQQLLKIEKRIDVAKIMKNIILLKQARLFDVSCTEDNRIQGVCIKFPTVNLQH